MALTPPPRRAPAPAEQHVVVCRLDAPRAHLGVPLGPGPLQRAVEDVAARQADGLLEVDRALDLDARVAVGVAGEHAEIGSASTESSERSVASSASFVAVSLSLAEEPRRQVQAEEGQRLRVARGELGPEDRAVAERVAVDLARRQVGDAPVARRGIRLLELARSPR